MTDKVYKSKMTKKKNHYFFLFCNCSASLIWSMHCMEVNVSAVLHFNPCDSDLLTLTPYSRFGLLLLAAVGSVEEAFVAHQDLALIPGK